MPIPKVIKACLWYKVDVSIPYWIDVSCYSECFLKIKHTGFVMLL